MTAEATIWSFVQEAWKIQPPQRIGSG